MKTFFSLLLLCLTTTAPLAFATSSEDVEVVQASTDSPAALPAKNGEPDSKRMEKDLQRLPWGQFRSVIEAIPKMKAGIEAYGPIGWQFVKANYTTYGWKKNIDKLDGTQQQRLAELIQDAKGGK